jgi:hypothetical protein
MISTPCPPAQRKQPPGRELCKLNNPLLSGTRIGVEDGSGEGQPGGGGRAITLFKPKAIYSPPAKQPKHGKVRSSQVRRKREPINQPQVAKHVIGPAIWDWNG